MQSTMHAYEVRPRKVKRGVNLISDALPFGRLWDGEPNAVGNAVAQRKPDNTQNWPCRNSLTGYCVFASSAISVMGKFN
jgi:hypothetical protein